MKTLGVVGYLIISAFFGLIALVSLVLIGFFNSTGSAGFNYVIPIALGILAIMALTRAISVMREKKGK